MKRAWCLMVLLLLFPVRVQAAQLETAGKSALLMDMETGTVLYERNAREALAPASVTKVMTMLLIMEAIDSGKIGWQDTVTASDSAAAKGGSQVYLKPGESMSVSDMVKSIAVSSANDCACAMAEFISGSEEAFVDAMNRRAGELGMEDTHFVNCTGLDDGADAAGHKTSARDIALMSRELMANHPDIRQYTTIWMDTVRDGAFGLSNTNKLIRFYPGATGLKTGYTTGAGYCLSATAERDGMGMIAVVMGCATSQERNAACKTLLDYGFANYALVQPDLSEVNPVPVKLGAADSIQPVLGQQGGILIDKAQKGDVTTEVTLEPAVTAPVSKGQRLGTMTIYSGQQILAQIPLVAENSVPRLSFWGIFKIVLGRAAMAGGNP